MRFRVLNPRGNTRDDEHAGRSPALRVRGWTVAFGAALLAWAAIVGGVVLIADLLR